MILYVGTTKSVITKKSLEKAYIVSQNKMLNRRACVSSYTTKQRYGKQSSEVLLKYTRTRITSGMGYFEAVEACIAIIAQYTFS